MNRNNQQNQPQKNQQNGKGKSRPGEDKDATRKTGDGKKNPFYESERKGNEDQFFHNPDDSGIRRSGSSAELDKNDEENEETTLNQSKVQEGPKGGLADNKQADDKKRRSA